jgi:NAD(P)H-flavin reductase
VTSQSHLSGTTSAGAGHPLLPAFARVVEKHAETADTFTLTLEPPPDRPQLGEFRPGQFNMLYAFGVGEAAISISGDPAAGDRIVHTIRAVGSVTRALERLGPGDSVGLRGPYGSAWPLEASRGHDVVLVTGGIGLPPLRPALYHLLRHRRHYGRVVLVHGARTAADLVYRDELAAWQARADLQVLITVDRGDPSWRGAVGVVTTQLARAAFDPARAFGLTCGPEVMMHFVLREFERLGVAGDRLYLSLERNMQCAVGGCGHCQLGPAFVCLDGPVFRANRIRPFLGVAEA